LTNQQLEEKFRDQAVLALPAARVEAIIEQSWRIDELPNAGALAAATAPEPVATRPASSAS
jgi:hypothetical protein